MNLKKLIPYFFRVRMKIVIRNFRDYNSNIHFAKNDLSNFEFPFSIEEKQIIKKSNYYENKIHNIKLGAEKIEQIIIKSGETFSFWKAVGNPNKKNKYKIGRNLIEGKLVANYGGGLCQLAGIIYLTALKANLYITERHHHSVDIYNENERFAPLGSDATVVYGYKDLRIKNTYDFPIRFRFSIDENSILCRLESSVEIISSDIQFIRIDKLSEIHVETLVNGNIAESSKYTKQLNRQ